MPAAQTQIGIMLRMHLIPNADCGGHWSNWSFPDLLLHPLCEPHPPILRMVSSQHMASYYADERNVFPIHLVIHHWHIHKKYVWGLCRSRPPLCNNTPTTGKQDSIRVCQGRAWNFPAALCLPSPSMVQQKAVPGEFTTASNGNHRLPWYPCCACRVLPTECPGKGYGFTVVRFTFVQGSLSAEGQGRRGLGLQDGGPHA
jgi:hypothetical protein